MFRGNCDHSTSFTHFSLQAEITEPDNLLKYIFFFLLKGTVFFNNIYQTGSSNNKGKWVLRYSNNPATQSGVI